MGSEKGACIYTDTEIFDVDGQSLVGDWGDSEKDDRQNLRFELETRGQSIANDELMQAKGTTVNTHLVHACCLVVKDGKSMM